MPALFRIASPSLMLVPPIQLASRGLPDELAYGFKRSAISVGLVMPCGASTTSRPSLLGSWAAISIALA